jgi:hypothetical protein
MVGKKDMTSGGKGGVVQSALFDEFYSLGARGEVFG